MFERLGSWTYRFRFLIVLAWIVGGGLCVAFAPSLAGSGSTDQAAFLPASAPSRQAKEALERAFPGSTSASSASVTLERASGLTPADLAYRDALAAWTTSDAAPAELRAAVTSTETADTRPELASMLRSGDGQFELLVINLDVETAGDAASLVIGQLRDHLAATAPTGLETHVTGAAAISSDYLDAIKAGTDSTTAVTVLLVLVVLLLIYRAPLAAVVPLATIGAAFVVSRGVLGLLASLGWPVSSLLDTFLVVMVFGVGTDYAIFLISRYREEVSEGGDWHDAARVTVKRIGAVISASAATVIVGMASMAFGDFQMITTTGPALGVAIFVTLVAGLTLAPALLSIFGHYLFWPLHTRPKPEGEPGGFFARLAAGVSHHPGLVTVGLLVVLLVPTLYLPQVKTNFDVLAELPAGADSRIGYEAVATHLGEDKLVQSTGLVDGGAGVDLLTPKSLANLRDLTAGLSATPGIATVTSLVTPDGDGVVPEGFQPSRQLVTIGDKMAGDGGTTGSDSASLLDPEVSDGLDTALDYVNGLALAFPDVAGGTELRALTGGIAHAQDIVTRVRKQSVLSTQLRTLSSSITSPAAAASGDSDTSETLMRDYLAELATAYPEVRSLDAWKDGVKAATSLEKNASVGAALDLADAFDRLALHFDAQPEATLSPKSLANTASALELKREAEDVFGALPDQFAALGAVFAKRPDDIYVPTTLTGEDGDKLQDAIDAFVSRDRTSTRFYVTSTNDPYSGDAFQVVRTAQGVITDGAAAFGPAASGHLGGPTAQFADVQDTLAADFQRVGVITVIGILLVLVILLRAIVAPLYLVATVLVSYGSAVGLSAWLFQEVLGQPGISFYLPLMVFVLLVALGSDYNIFLMSRVREESEHRPLRDGIRIASGYTGAVITSAGLILAGTFGSMATAPLIVLFQVGVAVAIGVLIDTFVVRSILVPAITTLVGDRAWWPSGAAGIVRRVTLAPSGAAPVAVPAMAAGIRGSRGRLAVALALVVLVPLTVAGLLTWSLGSASGNLASVHAAVVNLDEGGTLPVPGGITETLALGDDLVTALTVPGAGTFKWTATEASDAEAGLASGAYAAVLTIPADFSRTVAAIRADTTGSVARATLRLVTNDGSGYALGTVAREVTDAIGTATGDDVTASYVDDVLLAVTSAHDSLASAADDAGTVAGSTTNLADDAAGTRTVAGQLVAGLESFAALADDAKGGATELSSATRKLAQGQAALATGAKKVATGARSAADGATSLATGAAGLSKGLDDLAAGTSDLPAQTKALADGADGVATGAAGVAAGARSLADGLGTMAAGTDGLGDQAKALNAGAADLASGAATVADGAAAAAGGAADLSSGAGSLSDGVSSYVDGVAALAAGCEALGGSPEICASLNTLAAQGAPLVPAAAGVAGGADQLAGATSKLADGTAGIASGADSLHDGTKALAGALPGLEEGIASSAKGAGDLAAGAASLDDGATALAGGTRQLADAMPPLVAGIGQLADGGTAVATGASRLASGLATLSDGTDALAKGTKQAAAGAKALAAGTANAAGSFDGLTGSMQAAIDAGALVEAQAGGLADDGVALSDKAQALADKLTSSAGSTGSYGADTRSRMGSLAADPVGIDAVRMNAVAGPSSGLAPFLMAIAAWLGALGAFLVLPAAATGDDRPWWRAALIAYGAAATIAVAGALVMVVGMSLLLGIEVARVAELLGFAVLAALTFTAIVQALVLAGGMRGWLLGLLLLVIAVAASGIPLGSSTAPAPLGVLHALLPLTYAIDAFRGAIAGGGSAPGMDAVVLLAWLVVTILVGLAAAAGRDRRGTGMEVSAPAA